MILVLDSSARITLTRIGNLDLLQQLAETVHVPQAVYDEVVCAGVDQPGRRAVESAQWIVRHQVQDRDAVVRLRGRLGRGEAEAIVLAKRKGATKRQEKRCQATFSRNEQQCQAPLSARVRSLRISSSPAPLTEN